MKTAAVICEYNPLHLGHTRQYALIRSALGDDTRLVCLMSGNYVQRGEPAVFDKYTRAKAAVLSGADLVLELPVTKAVSSAEGFARGAVEILNRLGCVDYLCFGSESGDDNIFMSTARLLNSPAFSEKLRQGLTDGDSFASLRQRTLEALGGDGSLLQSPNDILAVEYCKALCASGSAIRPLAVRRAGSYHALSPDAENPSATALRAMLPGADWLSYVPEGARELFADADIHRMEWGERAVLSRLRAMTDAEFADLPYGSEGLWRKFMAASRNADSLEALMAQVKSRRYARSRIARMVLCAFLGITEQALSEPVPYVRILAFSAAGRAILRAAPDDGFLLHAGSRTCGAYAKLEERADRLYPLFLPHGKIPAICHHAQVFCGPEPKKIEK